MRNERRGAAWLALLLVLVGAGWPGTTDVQSPDWVRSLIAERQARLSALGPDSLNARRDAWRALAPGARDDLRGRYAAWRELDEPARVRVRSARLGFGQLPADEQAALRAQFAAMDALHRNGWRLGPELGRDYPRLQSLMAFVGEDERGPLLAALRGMTPQQREDLGALAQRTPPPQREALRHELVATAPAARATWLARRLAR